MFRKRNNYSAGFNTPVPFQPIAADHAKLRIEGFFPYSGIMQVAKEDVHVNYVVCRGFDVRIHRFIDYEEGNSDKPGIPVAKPYGKRSIRQYEIAEIYQALLPLQTTNPSPSDVNWRVRQNPGVSESGGHPDDLDEKIDELYTDDGSALVQWMLVDSAVGPGGNIEFTIDSVNKAADPDTAVVIIQSRPCGVYKVDGEVLGRVTVHDPSGCFLDEAAVDLVGRWGGASYQKPFVKDNCEWRITWLCCPPCSPVGQSSASSASSAQAMITGSGPGPFPGQFLP